MKIDNATKRALLTKAEDLWHELQEDNLGGYAGINRPFYIALAFHKIYQEGYEKGAKDYGKPK